MIKLSDALFTTTQQRVLGLLYSHPEKSFYTKEIIRATEMGAATIQRELERMLDAGIIKKTLVGNQHHYQADTNCPIYTELLAIVKKTFGVLDVIKSALLPLADQIDWAFIFGSIASGKEASGSDVDLLIIGDVEFEKVVNDLYDIQDKIGREINPKIYKKPEWLELKKKKDRFVHELLAKPKLDVLGEMDGLG